jgi:hypothetical protein
VWEGFEVKVNPLEQVTWYQKAGEEFLRNISEDTLKPIIPLGISFKYDKEHDGFIVYYNEGLDKPGNIQHSVAFMRPIGMLESQCYEAEQFCNWYVARCIEEIILTVDRKHDR